MFVLLTRKLFLPLLVGCIVSPCAAQFTVPKQSELGRSVNERLNNGKHDDAIALLNAAAAEPNPSPDVAETLFTTAQFFFQREKYDTSLSLLKQITDHFPNSSVASLAWCGLGQTYGRLGDNEKMIAALEQGISKPRVPTAMNIMDSGDTHGFACQTLGNHYIANRHWEKAFQIFTDWKPTSWCGTCLGGMQTHRSNHILLCQANLAQFNPLIEQAWRDITANGYVNDELAMFLLVRLYAESDQLDDLQLLTLTLLEQATKKFPIADSQTNQSRVRAILANIASLSDAIDNAKRKSSDSHLDALHSENRSAPIVEHVARWYLMRNQRADDIERAVLRAKSGYTPYLELLAAIDSPDSRQAMVDLASNGDIGRQQVVCGFIHHRMKSPEVLIARIVTRVPKDRARYTYSSQDPAPFHFRFYEAWTPPDKRSLPNSLPGGLFEKTN